MGARLPLAPIYSNKPFYSNKPSGGTAPSDAEDSARPRAARPGTRSAGTVPIPGSCGELRHMLPAAHHLAERRTVRLAEARRARAAGP